MKKELQIFDNGNKTADRYTVIIDGSVYGMSDDPLSPQGVNMYCCEENELNFDSEFLGKDITDRYLHLPHKVFVAIHRRVKVNN